MRTLASVLADTMGENTDLEDAEHGGRVDDDNPVYALGERGAAEVRHGLEEREGFVGGVRGVEAGHVDDAEDASPGELSCVEAIEHVTHDEGDVFDDGAGGIFVAAAAEFVEEARELAGHLELDGEAVAGHAVERVRVVGLDARVGGFRGGEDGVHVVLAAPREPGKVLVAEFLGVAVGRLEDATGGFGGGGGGARAAAAATRAVEASDPREASRPSTRRRMEAATVRRVARRPLPRTKKTLSRTLTIRRSVTNASSPPDAIATPVAGGSHAEPGATRSGAEQDDVTAPRTTLKTEVVMVSETTKGTRGGPRHAQEVRARNNETRRPTRRPPFWTPRRGPGGGPPLRFQRATPRRGCFVSCSDVDQATARDH